MSTAAGHDHGIRRAIATVCLSGMLEDKLDAAAAAGFDGVEIFEPDLIASSSTPAEVRNRCADLGLSIDLYQPFRDFDTVQPDQFTANLRRAEHKFDVMEELGTDMMLVCSSVDANAVGDTARIAEQFRALADRASLRGFKIAYEALAWGRDVNTWGQSWDVVNADLIDAMREFGILYDREKGGEFFHLYTSVQGSRVFFEVVQRVGSYSSYGSANSAVRMTAQRGARTSRPCPAMPAV